MAEGQGEQIDERLECARRCWQAAIEHLDEKDFRTAGALFRAAGRYVEAIGQGCEVVRLHAAAAT